MGGLTASKTAWLAVPAGLWCAALIASAAPARRSPPERQLPAAASLPAPSDDRPQVSAATCAECHPAMHRRWAGARHSKMLQPASPATVLGDFAASPVTLRGARFTLVREGDRFFVHGPFPAVEPRRHEVAFTLGSRRVQHYLTRLPDGRLVVLPPTWDVERREWFHNLDIVNPEESAENPVQVWNSSCFGCHVSGATKGFDPAEGTYDTRWTDFGTSCERCHGSALAHVQQFADRSHARAVVSSAIVVPTRLAPERSTMVCAQCHSLRDITVPGFAAGGDYYDHFTPVLEYAQKSTSDPAYWPDGRPRRFSNDAIGLWQSRCYVEGGATCTTCHADPHEPDVDRHPQLTRASNSLCAGCHAPIVEAGARHTRHAEGGAGSACIACHMPRTVVSLRSRMPDHTIGVPAPENTVRHGIPNACTECHRDRSPAWAVSALAAWYPNGRRERLVARADAFSGARKRDPAALDALIRLAGDPEQPPLVRANAIGYLRSYPGARAETHLAAALSSPHAPVRLTAALGLSEPGFAREQVTPVLINVLGDSSRAVRVAAMLSLANLQVTDLDPGAARLADDAARDYLRRAELLADDAAVQLDAGKLLLLTRKPEAAAGALEASLRLDGRLHAARYFLGLTRLAQGQVEDAKAELARIPDGNEYAPLAKQVLKKLR